MGRVAGQRPGHLGCLVFLACLVGCALPPTYTRRDFATSSSPEFAPKRAQIRSVVLLPPQVDVEEISAGGVSEKVDAWCATAKQAVTQAIEQELRARSIAAERLDPEKLDPARQANLSETLAMFQVLMGNVEFHNLGPTWARPPEALQMARYTLGSEVSALSGEHDALVVVAAHGHVASGGRRFLQVAAVVAGVAVGVATGVVLAPAVPGSGNAFSMALVDPASGQILWYGSSTAGAFIGDLRDCEDAQRAVRAAMRSFPPE